MPANSKGTISPLLIIAVLAIVGIGGYFLLQQKGSLPSPGISGPALTPRATEKDFESITEDPTLRKHFAAQANKTDYRYKGTSPGSGLTTVNEVQIKGDSFNTREIESDGNKERKHIIIIGDTTYLKDYTDNKWWKQTIKLEEDMPEEDQMEEPKDFKEEYSKPDLKYKALGKDNCGSHAKGLTCFKYEQIFPESPESKRFFWFDDKDYLLRKDQAGFGEFIATLEYSYDGINIQAPSPTKDVPEGRSIYEYSTGSDAMPASSTTNQAPQIPTDTNMLEPDSGDTGDY